MTPPGQSDSPRLRAAYNEAARERDLLRASVDLALPCIRIALKCAEREAQGRAERELRDAIYHLTVGTQ
jgi:hypothetical protein